MQDAFSFCELRLGRIGVPRDSGELGSKECKANPILGLFRRTGDQIDLQFVSLREIACPNCVLQSRDKQFDSGMLIGRVVDSFANPFGFAQVGIGHPQREDSRVSRLLGCQGIVVFQRFSICPAGLVGATR